MELKKFYTHLVVYLAMVAFLFFVDYSDGGNWWIHWVAIGWGIFVVFQGASIGILNPEWEEKKIKEMMGKK